MCCCLPLVGFFLAAFRGVLRDAAGCHGLQQRRQGYAGLAELARVSDDSLIREPFRSAVVLFKDRLSSPRFLIVFGRFPEKKDWKEWGRYP